MHELNTISNAIKTMSSKEIEALTGKHLAHVHRDIREMLDQLQDDPELDHVCEDKDVRGYTTCYYLPKGLSLTLVAGYSVKLRKAIIDRWQELEAKVAAPAVPQSLSAALRLAADQADQIEAQQAQIAIAAPKVAFVDRYVVSTGLKGFREVCKLLGANESRFREFLTDNQIMYRLGGSMTAHAQHLDAGRFEVRAGSSEVSGHAFNACKFTSKGVEWIAGEWAKHQIRAEVAA
jgi:phage antirepressor YoqD-like protein